jgi:hypothetical protein
MLSLWFVSRCCTTTGFLPNPSIVMQTWSTTQVNQVSSARKEPVTVEPAWDFAYLQSHITDQMQWRYELIRPLVLFEIGTPRQRAHETHTHPGTVRTFVRQFQKQGMLGLMLGDVVVVKRGRTPPRSRAGPTGNSPAQSALWWVS